MAQTQAQDSTGIRNNETELISLIQSQRPPPGGCRKVDIKEVEEVFKKKNFRRALSIFDNDKDGKIDIHELKAMIHRLGNRIPHDVSVRVLNMADTDNDGYLDLNEFMTMVNNPTFTSLFGRYVTNYVESIIPKRNHLGTFIAGRTRVDEIEGQFEDEYSCWPPPIAMVLISVIIIVFYSIDAGLYDATHGTGPMAGALMYDPHKRYEAWRFFTYMFVHIGYMHIAVNLLVQILLGIPLEMVHKPWRIIIVYFTGVLAGSLATSIVDPKVYLAGASGGVYSLITAHIASVIMNWKEMALPFVQLFVFLIITTVDFGTAIYNRYYLQQKDHIGYEAHFAGAAAGLLVGIFVLRNLERNSCEDRLRWISFVVFMIFGVTAILFHIFYPSYFPKEH